jgi:hypothetical protein
VWQADFVWVRLLDVAAALTAREYAVDAEIVIETEDALRPEVAGRYRLVASRGGAKCERVTDDADLRMNVADLGALYLGGVPATTLAHSGRGPRPTGRARRGRETFGPAFAADVCSPLLKPLGQKVRHFPASASGCPSRDSPGTPMYRTTNGSRERHQAHDHQGKRLATAIRCHRYRPARATHGAKTAAAARTTPARKWTSPAPMSNPSSRIPLR